jgi:hypothetical protein
VQFAVSALNGDLHGAEHLFELAFLSGRRAEQPQLVEDVKVQSGVEGELDRFDEGLFLGQLRSLPAAVCGEVLEDLVPAAPADLVGLGQVARFVQRLVGVDGGDCLDLERFGRGGVATAVAATARY